MSVKRAMVAMSGGVDSSVAALLTKQMGYDTAGVTLRLFTNEDIGERRGKTCCSLDDVEDARSVAYLLDIPYHVFNFSYEFREEVIERFINTYIDGKTPNPCIDCNHYIKFDKLINRAQQLDYDYVVTGHYSKIEYDNASGRYLLKKAVDLSKDQSYVLYMLTQDKLSKLLLPLGNMHKTEIRQIALENGFVNAKKHDSQDICFVRDGDYAGFIENYTGKSFIDGDFTDTDGNVLGKHKGIVHYTIGQRKGIGISFHEPMYVCGKDAEKNTVTLGRENQLFSRFVTADNINLITQDSIDRPMKVKAKIRYRQEEQPAVIEQTSENQIRIEFDFPQRAVSPGQAVVFYDGDVVVGGGRIV